MNTGETIRVSDVMANTYVIIDGLTTVLEAIEMAKSTK